MAKMAYDKPCRVLLLTTQSGTAFVFALPYALYLQEKNFEVTIGCTSEPQHDVPSYQNEIEEAGIEFLDIPIARQIAPLQDLKAYRMLRELFEERSFDIIHTYNAKAGIIGRIAAKRSNVDYIIHQDMGLPFFKGDLFSLQQSIVFWTIEWVAARFTDRILTISDYEYQKAERFHIAHPPKLVNVDLGVNTDFFDRDKVSPNEDSPLIAELRELAINRPVIGSVSRLVIEKGIDIFIKAAAIVVKDYPDLLVLIAGGGSERSRLEAMVEALDLSDNVHFVGFVIDQRDVRQLYSILDVFVLPTRWESFGLVFAEAMSMYVPVVGSRIEPITTVVADGETGYLAEQDNVEEFATSISKLLKNPDLRAKFGEAGRKRVLAMWDQRSIFDRMFNIYTELQH